MADRRNEEPASPWFEKARSDLRSAEALLALDPPELSTGLFHCQQAAEKYLKGLLAHLGEDPPRTHDLVVLLDLLVSADSRLELLYEPAELLTPYAVQVRYPFVSDTPTEEEADAALRAARTIQREATAVVDSDGD